LTRTAIVPVLARALRVLNVLGRYALRDRRAETKEGNAWSN